VFAPDQRGTGWHAYTPLETPTGSVILINRGHVRDDERKAGVAEQALPPGAEVEIVGLLRRPGSRNVFTPSNIPDRNTWYWRDLTSMLQSAYPGGVRQAVPFSIDVEAPPAGAEKLVPRPGTTVLTLPNRHLEYALTWYGLAATLAVIYASFAWQRLRAPRDRTMFSRRGPSRV
jgi:surfeit locus 1 family protein